MVHVFEASNWSQQSYTYILMRKSLPLFLSIFSSSVAFVVPNCPFTVWLWIHSKKLFLPGEGWSSSGPRYSTLLTVRFGFRGPPNPPSRTAPSEQQPWVGELGSWHRRPLDNATSVWGREGWFAVEIVVAVWQNVTLLWFTSSHEKEFILLRTYFLLWNHAASLYC